MCSGEMELKPGGGEVGGHMAPLLPRPPTDMCPPVCGGIAAGGAGAAV